LFIFDKNYFFGMSKYLNELINRVKKGNNVFIAPNAYVLGNVTLGNDVSVWYGAVLRADFDDIEIGDRTNIQEGVLMHVDHGTPIKVGKDNVIGHGAILHGCTIGNYNLIGMRATIMNNAKIGNGCVIGAHALVTENMIVPDYSMVLGSPGKIVKTLPEDVKFGVLAGVEEYISEAKKYLE
jgi:carbonic anhydrase/acetyltransferase-like protein (isoleucine patch superfamily)